MIYNEPCDTSEEFPAESVNITLYYCGCFIEYMH